jgi:tRNA/rRNA methyltransferase
MVICYCLSTAGLNDPPAFTPRLAKHIELEQMYDELTAALVRIGYLNPDNPDYWMNRIRRFGSRLSLRAGEVGIVRGICRQIQRYGDRRYAEGVEAGEGRRL